MKHGIRVLAGLCLAAALSAGAAQAAGFKVTWLDRAVFIMEPSPAPAGEVVARKQLDPLATGSIHASAAARLEQAVVVGDRTLPAGTLLFAATKGATPYFCAPAPAKNGVLVGVTYSCLRDAGGAGVFTAARSGEDRGNTVDFFGILEDRTVGGFVFKREVPLPAPIRYTLLDGKDGPSANVRLLWQVTAAKKDKPAQLVVWTSHGVPGSPNRSADGIPESIDLEGGQTGRKAFSGATFVILGVGADGSLRYRVDGQFAPSRLPLHVHVYTAPTVIYF
jgi:hypothetical protein